MGMASSDERRFLSYFQSRRSRVKQQTKTESGEAANRWKAAFFRRPYRAVPLDALARCGQRTSSDTVIGYFAGESRDRKISWSRLGL